MSLRDTCLRELSEVRTAYFVLGERLLDLEERFASLSSFEGRPADTADASCQQETPRSIGTASASPSSVENSVAGNSYPASAATGLGNGEIQREAAILTGQFFRRALSDQHLGRSGRELVRLPNNFYVVIRDFQGRVTDSPVRVFQNYPEAIRVVSGPGGALGNSVFAGFNTIWEARLSVEEAGLEFPADLEQE